MDACEILKMEGYVSALDDEPDGEESPPSADAAQAHSPKPEIVNHVALPAHATQNVFFCPASPCSAAFISSFFCLISTASLAILLYSLLAIFFCSTIWDTSVVSSDIFK